MKLKIDPIAVVVLSVLIGWGWYKLTDKPVCYVHEQVDGKTVEKPVYCEDIYEEQEDEE